MAKRWSSDASVCTINKEPQNLFRVHKTEIIIAITCRELPCIKCINPCKQLGVWQSHYMKSLRFSEILTMQVVVGSGDRFLKAYFFEGMLCAWI